MLKENGLNQLSSKSNLAVRKWIVWVLKFHMTMSFAQRLCTKFLFSLQGCHAMTNKRILCYRWKISREIIKKGSWLTPSALTFSLQCNFFSFNKFQWFSKAKRIKAVVGQWEVSFKFVRTCKWHQILPTTTTNVIQIPQQIQIQIPQQIQNLNTSTNTKTKYK